MTFICDKCGLTFRKQFNLRRHFNTVHNDKIIITCKYCDKKLYKADLQEHIQNLHEDGKFKCLNCYKKFTSKQKYKQHKCKANQTVTGDSNTPRNKSNDEHSHDPRSNWPSTNESCPSSSSSCSYLRLPSSSVHRESSPQPEPSYVHVPSQRPTQSTSSNNRPSGHRELSPQPGPSHAHSPLHQERSATRNFHCRQCHVPFDNRHDLYIHQMREHVQRGAGFLQPSPYSPGEEPWINNPELKEVYDINTPLILQRHVEGTVHSTYNMPLTNDFSVHELMESVDDIYERQQHAFRLNLEFGMILVNTDSGEYRYFRPFSNQSLFERPIYVSRRHDLTKLRKRLERFNVVDYILKQRPDTKWRPVLVTNVHFTLFHLNYLLGAPVELPDYITSSRSIIALHKNRKGVPYNDDLCAFRCLATHYQGRERLESVTQFLHAKWKKYLEENKNQENEKSSEDTIVLRDIGTEGLSLDQVAYFETCFEINVNIYQLNPDGSACSIFKSRCHYKDSMNLNTFQNHLSYITNFNTYASKYQCQTCNRHFGRIDNMQRHQRICKGRTVHQFPGDFYTAPKTIFDKLEENGIRVPRRKRLFPWFCVYDFEAMLLPVQEGSDKLQWTSRHVPISVSVCSNVDDYTTPHCIVDSNVDRLVRSMVDYMQDIAKAGEVLAREKFKRAFELLDELITESNEDEGSIDNSDGADFLGELKEELEDYCKQMLCLGFNSSNYDLNLIKSHIAKHLNMEENNVFTVKRNNQYACLATSTLKFLDITSYLSPGINYAKFLKAFDVSEDKGFFPYDWLDDVSKLEYPSLPPHAAFYSALKSANISLEDYEFCQRVWEENNMTAFKDFLVWYNNLDVGPFVSAVENLQKYYFQRNIDIFKVSISVPGLARHMLFECGREAGASFALCDEANKDLYYTIKENIIGGPSIIFNRYHETGVTNVRNNPNKPCQRIVGFDANALYLFCIGQPMPTGPFVRRRLDEQFKPEKKEKYMLAYHWLDWLNESRGLHIKHKLNSGKEKKIGPYPVDGYDENTNTVYQFHGCYWHGHRCWMTKSQQGKEKWESMASKSAKKTEETTKYLKDQGYTVVEMRECSFRSKMRFNTRLKAYIDARQPPTPQRQMTEIEILKAVVEEKLFGMIEVDIHVPEQWPAHFQHPTMAPYEYFGEMSPLFCTSEVPHDVIGEHMQNHVKELNLSTKPRRLLVGGMRAKKMLLATPLLKWYIEHGLVVTKIYQTVEYTPKRCFQQFVKDVSDARRTGDADPSKAIIADTRKLEGNSAFGSTIMDQEKFQDVSYVKGDGPAMLQANLPQFKKLTKLVDDEQYYEIEKARATIKLNLPVQIGYFILQYGKLHMLQFYYDFLDKYVDRSDFEYCEMDTDSAYMALAAPDFQSVVKPEMKAEYLRGLEGHCRAGQEIEADCKHHWFPRTCCQQHAKYDKRTPGLFKIEYEGDAMIGLCSKTYIVAKKKTRVTSNTMIKASSLLRKAQKLKPKRLQPQKRTYYETKFSSKGISKKSVTAPLTIFRQVLKTKRPGHGTNRGLRARNNTIYTYHQERCGFSYFYCKRKVLSDGRTTVPLDLELCPSREEEEDADCEEIENIKESTDVVVWDDQDLINVNTLLSLMEEEEQSL